MGTMQLWLLQRQYDEICTNFRTTWDLYLKFYTVFLTFNVLGMAWLFGERSNLPQGSVRFVLCGSFIAQDLLTAATSLFMVRYSLQARARQCATESELLRLSGESDKSAKILAENEVPTNLAKWAGLANFCGMMLVVAGWVSLALLRS